MVSIKGKTGAWSIPHKKSRRGITIEVRVQPRSSRLGIEGVVGGVLKVHLTAPPAEGEANAQLVKLLSSELGIRKSSIKIIKGLSSRNKVVEITDAAGSGNGAP